MKKKIIVAMVSLALFTLAVLFSWPFIEVMIGKSFPKKAWTYGTPTMQRYAAQELIKDIKEGMTFDEVFGLLEKGISQPEYTQNKKGKDGTVSFNVRSWYNNGIDVVFKEGKVTEVFYYD